MTEDAAIVLPAEGDAPVVIGCEHASERLPEPWRWPEADRRLLGTHWSHDLGVEAITRALAARIGAGAVLAHFTRLLADPNRPPDSPTLFRKQAEGLPIELNAAIDEDERRRRLAYWEGYHQAFDQLVATSRAPVVFAIHSFTDSYEGSPRDFELGVLFDRQETLGRRLRDALGEAGFDVRLNEPYSGKEGLIYSAQRHALAYGRAAVEIEVRQDVAVDPARRAALVTALEAFDFAGSRPG